MFPLILVEVDLYLSDDTITIAMVVPLSLVAVIFGLLSVISTLVTMVFALVALSIIFTIVVLVVVIVVCVVVRHRFFEDLRSTRRLD